MKTRLLAAIVVALIFRALPALADLSPDDFYCFDAPSDLGPPLIYDMAVRNCPGVSEKPVQNLCMVYSKCVVLTPAFRKQLGTDYDSLSPMQRVISLAKYNNTASYTDKLTAHDALLNCAAKLNDKGQLFCPMPDQCKREVIFTPPRDKPPTPADFDPADKDALEARLRGISGTLPTFTRFTAPPVTPPAPAPASGPADSAVPVKTPN